MIQKAALFWSGGKDSAMALYLLQKEYLDLEVVCLVTTINEEYRRISMHGVREELLELQARETGYPLIKMIVPNIASNDAYETELAKLFMRLKSEGVTHIVYGDIFLEDLRQYRLSILQSYGLTGIFPLWKQETKILICDFISLEFNTITCCISTETLTEEFLGKELNHDFVNSLPATVDPCGENGEFHTFCFKGPVFKNEIEFVLGEKKYKPLSLTKENSEGESGFWFIDILPKTSVDSSNTNEARRSTQ